MLKQGLSTQDVSHDYCGPLPGGKGDDCAKPVQFRKAGMPKSFCVGAAQLIEDWSLLSGSPGSILRKKVSLRSTLSLMTLCGP